MVTNFNESFEMKQLVFSFKIRTEPKLTMNCNSFSPLNFALLLSGLHLLPNNLWVKILNWTLLVLSAVGSLCHLTELLDYSFHIITRKLVSTLMWNIEVVNNFIFIFVILKNRKHLDSILKRILPLLSNEDKRCLWKLSISGCTCSILVIIHVIVVYLANYFVQNSNEEHSFTLFDTISYILGEMECFSVCGRFVYCFYIRMICLREKQVLQKIEKESKSLTPGSVSNELRKLYAFKNLIQDKFSVLPLFWFFKELVFCLASVVSEEESWSQENPTFYWLMIMPVVYSLLLHIFMVCYVDHCKQDVDAQIDRLTHSLASQDYEKWHTIISELDRAKGFNFTASNLFDVNKRTGLSFISSLITLTVLFQQLLCRLPVE